jgi:hypothetical protein
MMKIRAIWLVIIALLLSSVSLSTGCQKASFERSLDPFTTTYSLSEEGRAFSISGNSAGHRPGQKSEFQLRLDNGAGANSWQGEYRILLVDEEGVLKKITQEQFELAIGANEQKSVTVDFPQGFEGPIGLGVVFPQLASTITTLWVGEKTGDHAGPWPSISVY